VSDERHVVIVGASAAGLRCAARLARLQPEWRITVVEQREVFSYAACGMPYVLSGDIAGTDALQKTQDGTVRDAAYFADVKRIKVLAGWRAAEVGATERTLRVVSPHGERTLEWDELVLATGARPRRLSDQPDHPRVSAFHTLADVAPLHEALSRGRIQQVVVVGAGFLGCELAEAFRALWGVEVVLVEAAEYPLSFMLDPEVGDIVTQVLKDNGVRVHLKTPVTRLSADEDQAVVYAEGDHFVGDVALVALGVEPAVELARQTGVELGRTGAIAVDERLATSVDHIWAVGDATEQRLVVTGEPCYLPLGSLANRQGRTLANILAGRDDRFPAVAGAAAVKVFDSNVAAVGLTRRKALASGLTARAVWIPGHDCAHYWPEAKEIALQLVYDAGSQRVLGVQAVGEGEVAKRIDVAAQLIARGATLTEFAHLEHAYSPPYAPALEPLAVAAMVALNAEDGVVGESPVDCLASENLLDVRQAEEIEARPLPGREATAIPQEELAERLGELDDKSWLIICERGTRSAEAVRLLGGEGISARFMGGGLRWRWLTGRTTSREP
jgi:NADPH-dependent 2,4-dienoyl-CoA reductase/sulfur reductase-like enzyme/rhodanese-related sulfurtransferase